MLDDNDKIGAVRTDYTEENNFGIGSHSDRSQQHGDSETLGGFQSNLPHRAVKYDRTK